MAGSVFSPEVLSPLGVFRVGGWPPSLTSNIFLGAVSGLQGGWESCGLDPVFSIPLYLFSFKIFIGVELIYNVVLVSGV